MDASEPSDDRLDLLLADADDGRPTLERGLPKSTIERLKKPKKNRDDVGLLREKGKNLNRLERQRWAVVVSDDAEGEAQLEAMAKLIALRREEQGVPPKIYKVAPGLTLEGAIQWKHDKYWVDHKNLLEQPLYLLMLGDLHQTPLELQHVLANDALVGRVHFTNEKGETDLDGYAAYAEKVNTFARKETANDSPDLLFYCANDGTQATTVGRVRLVEPCIEAAEAQRLDGGLRSNAVLEIAPETVPELLAVAGASRPSVLLSVSHGLGPPRGKSWSDEEQRMRQGAMVMRHDQILDGARLGKEPFLPGGMWFYLACYGAGTPSESAFAPWLRQLADAGAYTDRIDAVRRGLPGPDQRAFVAGLPQAALRSASGPLAVISHMDLAWTYSFSGIRRLSESRKMRIFSVIEAMVRGNRAGVALDALMDFYRTTNDDLTVLYSLERSASASERPNPAERAHTWMLRNDLRGYVLLGDPAARLPLSKKALKAADEVREEEEVPESERASVSVPVSVSVSASASASVSASVSASASVPASASVSASASVPVPAPVSVPVSVPVSASASVSETLPASILRSSLPAASAGVLQREAAVMAMLVGDEAPSAIAKRAGVSLAVLWTWVDAFRAGGRERLGQ